MKKETKELTKGERSVVLELSRPFNIFFRSTELHPASQCSKTNNFRYTFIENNMKKNLSEFRNSKLVNSSIVFEVIGTVFFCL